MTNSEGRWTDEDTARAVFEALPEDHPCRAVRQFSNSILAEEDATALAELVTPEVLDDWGDFSSARRYFFDQAFSISTRSLRHREATDVAYVKLVPDDGIYLSEKPRQDMIGWVTLVWRPELGGWKLHCIGQPAPPHLLPRTAVAGEVPMGDNDEEVTLEQA
ncbi:hypothetical protein [Microbacterium sorbitolivorans]|uniref:Uncharacterized protein n=1 Tax=Microbacterium sorbitolivorans TaxID=1867410 RepID=A0A367Y7F7_9MICO|nr:hypothetical protein [Microbacterium sorbitolivorans]RCK61550.1 hypothetical protein DTO57_02635 [Microbacterium sorbitolivorans]